MFGSPISRMYALPTTFEWQDSVLDKDLAAAPGAPSVGDRYIVGAVVNPADAWFGHDDEIAEWNGAAWVFSAPASGTIVYVEDEALIYCWTTAWNSLSAIVPGVDTQVVFNDAGTWGADAGLTFNKTYSLTSAGLLLTDAILKVDRALSGITSGSFTAYGSIFDHSLENADPAAGTTTVYGLYNTLTYPSTNQKRATNAYAFYSKYHDQMLSDEAAYAYQWVRASANVTAGETVTVNGKVYTWRAVIAAVEGEVLLGANITASLTNLAHAINGTGTYGVEHSCAAANPDAEAVSVSSYGMAFRARTVGSAGDALTFAEGSTKLTKGSGGFFSRNLDSVVTSAYGGYFVAESETAKTGSLTGIRADAQLGAYEASHGGSVTGAIVNAIFDCTLAAQTRFFGIGLQAQVINLAGTMSSARGIVSEIQAENDAGVTGWAAFTECTLFRGDFSASTPITIDYYYGLYLADPDSTGIHTISNKYGIYVSGSSVTSAFEGPVTVSGLLTAGYGYTGGASSVIAATVTGSHSNLVSLTPFAGASITQQVINFDLLAGGTTGANTVTTLIGLDVAASLTRIMLIGGGGGDSLTVTDYYGIRINAPVVFLSTVTNAYGLYIADQSAVGSVLAYNLYSAGATALNYIEGDLTVAGTLTASIAAAGSDTHVMYNDGGVFAGDANFTWAKLTYTHQIRQPANDALGSYLTFLKNRGGAGGAGQFGDYVTTFDFQTYDATPALVSVGKILARLAPSAAFPATATIGQIDFQVLHYPGHTPALETVLQLGYRHPTENWGTGVKITGSNHDYSNAQLLVHPSAVNAAGGIAISHNRAWKPWFIVSGQYSDNSYDNLTVTAWDNAGWYSPHIYLDDTGYTVFNYCRTDDATGPVVELRKGRTYWHAPKDGSDGDTVGTISFKSYDDGTPTLTEYAKISSEIVDASDATEAGALRLGVNLNGSVVNLLNVASREVYHPVGWAVTNQCVWIDATGYSKAFVLRNSASALNSYNGTWMYHDSVNGILFVESSLSMATGGKFVFAPRGLYQYGLYLTNVGNLSIGSNSSTLMTFGTSAEKCVGFPIGVAPTTVVQDFVQIWGADYAAGDTRLYIMSEANLNKTIIGKGGIECLDVINDANALNNIVFTKNRGGTGAAGVDGDMIGAINFYSYDDAGSPGRVEYARISGSIRDNATAARRGYLRFWGAGEASGTVTEVMRLGGVAGGNAANDLGVSVYAPSRYTALKVTNQTDFCETNLRTGMLIYDGSGSATANGFRMTARYGGNLDNVIIGGFPDAAYYSLVCYADGNFGFGNYSTKRIGTNGVSVIGIGPATAPTTCPADSVQLWNADYVAGDARLYIMGELSTDKAIIGNGILELTDGTNGVRFDESGLMEMFGDAVCTVRERPSLVAGAVSGAGKPTSVKRGAFAGYSLPLYAADEELFFRCNAPRRWDGTTNPTVTVIGYLDTAETDGDDFQLQLDWFNELADNSSNQLADTTNEVKSGNIDCPAPRNAQYTIFSHTFTIDYDVADPHLLAGDLLAFRLRRVAVEAGGVEIAGEFVVVDVYVTWTYNKIFYHA